MYINDICLILILRHALLNKWMDEWIDVRKQTLAIPQVSNKVNRNIYTIFLHRESYGYIL